MDRIACIAIGLLDTLLTFTTFLESDGRGLNTARPNGTLRHLKLGSIRRVVRTVLSTEGMEVIAKRWVTRAQLVAWCVTT